MFWIIAFGSNIPLASWRWRLLTSGYFPSMAGEAHCPWTVWVVGLTCAYCSMHFVLVVVVNPWACLDEKASHKTTILYFDSMSGAGCLATPAHFARFAVECDAMRHGKGISEPIDPAVVSTVQSWIGFEIVNVSPLLCIGSISCRRIRNAA